MMRSHQIAIAFDDERFFWRSTIFVHCLCGLELGLARDSDTSKHDVEQSIDASSANIFFEYGRK